jgi:hypothetical protein
LVGPSEIDPKAPPHEVINEFFGLTNRRLTAEEFQTLVRRATASP